MRIFLSEFGISGFDNISSTGGEFTYQSKGSHHVPIVQFFFNIVQTAFDPPPSLVLNMYVAIFFKGKNVSNWG